MQIKLRIIEFEDKLYPENLRKIDNPPKKIYANGNIEILNSNCISIIGSRKNTKYGEKWCEKFIKEFVKYDLKIVSGMALGIDKIAHSSAIKYGGKTIAVLPSGLEKVYPMENLNLYNQIILNGGCVISEYEPEVEAISKRFLERNRIVSGLSIATVVVEAAYRSGTSITAKYAKIQERKVLCIPNSIGNKNSYGTINLIQNGAIMVKNAQDILKVLGIEYDKQKSIVKFKQLELLDNESKLIFDCINKNEEIDAEGISMKTGINISKVNELVTILEIDEVIKSVGFNKFKICEEYYE